ncbi:hypothetical protein [Pseudomonas sp.]|uniref:hypothetical protein n=1 Tax=Pseudomonas sp. TaxID=306 RepID=UPI0028A7133D|nr:hypothetical protein [Pseudomonas sp.]
MPREEGGTGKAEMTSIFCFASFATRQLPLFLRQAEALCRFSGIAPLPESATAQYFRAFKNVAQPLLYLAQRHSGQPSKVSPT